VARKRKTLPKDFEALLETVDAEELRAVFDRCELDAYGGYSKDTALAFSIPDELARWLVSGGLDVDAANSRGSTPLQERASLGQDFTVLLELGADVNAAHRSGYTPLHAAVKRAPFTAATVGTGSIDAVRQLVVAGADVNAKTRDGYTPLVWALLWSKGPGIPTAAHVAQLLLDAGATTDGAKTEVERLGRDLEFRRSEFDLDDLPQVDQAMHQLYELFQVTPVVARTMHDNLSPISVSATTWQEQYDELWELLVPASGPAATVQGEVIRISGRLRHEILDNGAGNWDADFRTMANALGSHLASGSTVDPAEAKHLLSQILDDDGTALYRLSELAVAWVLANSDPTPLPKPEYRR